MAMVLEVHGDAEMTCESLPIGICRFRSRRIRLAAVVKHFGALTRCLCMYLVGCSPCLCQEMWHILTGCWQMST